MHKILGGKNRGSRQRSQPSLKPSPQPSLRPRVGTWGGWVMGAIALTSFTSLAVQLANGALAVQLADGKTYFVRPPQLVGTTTSYNSTDFPLATYSFTLTLPETAGEPLQKVVIAQDEGPDRLFWEGDSADLTKGRTAFDGAARRSGSKLPLSAITVDAKARTATVIFEPPVPPGKTITIALYPLRNPNVGGVYLYGVTAYPPGAKAVGQFLGYGRIHIYESHDAGRRRWP